MVMTWVVAAGLLLGVSAAVVARGKGRGKWLASSYAALVAGVPWTVAAIVMGNRAEGMAGIPYLVFGGALFWFFLVPVALSVGLQESARSRDSER